MGDIGGIREVRYLTDDRDEKRRQRHELVISWGNNGDWYVAVVPEGEGTLGKGVRISTSGGAQFRVPGLGISIAEAFRAIAEATEGYDVKHIKD